MPAIIVRSVGVDIAKDTLEVHLHPAGRVGRFANNACGYAALIAWLGELAIARVAFEPTGAYHHAFERRLAEAGLPLVKVNPRQARRFAEAIGRQAKTDAVDAAMLARFAALLEPPLRPAVSATVDAMPGSAKVLQVARRALVKDRVAAGNRKHSYRSALLKRQASQRLRQIDRQLAAIDTALHMQIAEDPALQARFDILLSIPGVGHATAFAMLAEMPELGALTPKSAASLAGLAPIAHDSGRHRGKRSIRGGRRHLRQALYMPALVAVRFDAVMKAKYQTLRAAGKPPKVALTAIMRKLLILANTLLRDRRAWSPRLA